MKKVLAIVFALVFALSCATTAFAAVNLVCPDCGATGFETEAAYNKHIESECPYLSLSQKPQGPYTCEFCGNVFKDKEQYEIHVNETCPKRETSWGDEVENFFLNLDYEDFTNVLDKVTEALTGIGLPGIVNTIIGLLEDAVIALLGAI